jgi:hypothetical protein
VSQGEDDRTRTDVKDSGVVAERAYLRGRYVAGRDMIVNVLGVGQPVPAVHEGPTPHARRRLIEQVRSGWVDPMQADAAPGIELKLRVASELVRSPFQDLVQQLPLPAPRLERLDSITTVFDELFTRPDGSHEGGTLLVVGSPGSGKTTLLTQLARDLLRQAELEADYPVPVAFFLSSWTPDAGHLQTWMANQLGMLWRATSEEGRAWVEGPHLLPLLDGLDEVARQHQEACIDAINELRRSHPLPIIVSSRESGYLLGKGTALELAGAVRIAPLHSDQVDLYLRQEGHELAGVRAALRNDPSLRDLATTPFLLTTMRRAYAGRSATEVSTPGGPEEQRMRILHAYTEAVFKRGPKAPVSNKEDTLHWLAWIARSLLAENQTTFDPGWMQPSWLPDERSRLIVTVGPALCVGLSAGLLAGLAWLFSAGASGAAWAVPLVGIVAALLFYSEQIQPVERTRWSFSAFAAWIRHCFVFGLRLFGTLAVVVGGLLSLWLIYTSIPEQALKATMDILVAGLILAVLSGLVVGLVGGFFAGRVEVPRIQGEDALGGSRAWVRAALRSATPFAVLFALLGAVVGSPGGVAVACAYAVSAGLIAALVMARKAGAMAQLQHAVLLQVANFYGLGPRRHPEVVAFLDYASDRNLLVKRGTSSYQFFHAFLAEYFAALEPQPVERRAPNLLTGSWTSRPVPWPNRDGGSSDVPMPVRQVGTITVPSGLLVLADFDAAAMWARTGPIEASAKLPSQKSLDDVNSTQPLRDASEIGIATPRTYGRPPLVIALPVGAFPVVASRWHKGHVHAEWTELELRLQPSIDIRATEIAGYVELGSRDLLVADGHALQSWTKKDPPRQEADVEIWSDGTAADAAAARFGVPRLSSRTWGWRDLPLPEARRRARALRWWARRRGRSLRVIVRQHLQWHDLLTEAHNSENGLAIHDLAEGTVMALETPFGGRRLAVTADVGEDEKVVQIRVSLV